MRLDSLHHRIGFIAALTLCLASATVLSAQAAGEPVSIAQMSINVELESARAAWAAGEPQLAEHHDRRASTAAWTGLGQLELAAGRVEAAEQYLARAASAAPVSAIEARALLAAIRVARGDVESMSELRLAVVAAPDHALARRLFVRALASSGTFDEARRELADLRRLDAVAADRFAPRLDEAASAPERAAALFGSIPESTLADLEAGDAARLRDRLEKAVEESESRLAKISQVPEPDVEALTPAQLKKSPAALLALARSAARRGSGPAVGSSPGEKSREGSSKLAFDYASQAWRMAPASETLLSAYVNYGFDAELVQVVAPAVETLARMRPEDGAVAALVGRVWMALGDSGEAVEALQRALDLDDALADARRLLGLALLQESRYEEARGHLQRFLSELAEAEVEVEAEARLEAMAGLAEAEQRLGDGESAEARARLVLEHDPRHALAHLVIGRVELGRGDFAKARAALEAAVAADASLGRAHYQLSFACSRLGDRECAKKHLALYRRAQAGPEAQMQSMQPVQLDGKPVVTKQGGGR